MAKAILLTAATLRSLCFIGVVAGSALTIRAQKEDTLNLRMFDYSDLETDQNRYSKTIISANRLAETPDDMAQEVIVIDGATIRKFGYSTLVDVLENLPEFAGSQPGNCIEGETFLMRGLYGNDHVKFLINGIPVKPEAVKGMPIAGQLPVRHAERIEIILGPSSASYGSESMAGVINIMLPEIDRPVFAWADVNLLSPNTTDFNLTLGGKAGSGKNIINYELFASTYRSSDVNLLIPDDSIRVKPGQLNSIQQSLFIGTEGVPEVDYLKRESRMLGAYFTFKGFGLSLMNMFREEHSGLGSQPLQHGYFDPNLSYGENINSLSLKYNGTEGKRFQTKAFLSALAYRTTPNSAYFGVTHLLSNGYNFTYARSLDINSEIQEIWKINKSFNMAFGASADYSISHPFTNFLLRPYKDDSFSFALSEDNDTLQTAVLQSSDIRAISMLDTTQFMTSFTKYDVAGFAQSSYRSASGKLIAEAGLRVDINSFNEVVLSPKLGVVYRPSKKWKIRSYYGRGYRAPKSYYIYNNYTESAQAFSQGERLKRSLADIESEKMHGAELNVTWQPIRQWNLSVAYYVHYLEHKVLRQVFVPDSNQANSTNLIGFGYFNGGSFSLLQSIAFISKYSLTAGKVKLSGFASYEYSRGEERLDAPDDAPDAGLSAGYRFVPRHMAKMTCDLAYSDFTLSIRGSMIGTFITDIFKLNGSIMYTHSAKPSYNMDVLLHKQLFRQLSIFGGVYNVFNSLQRGIPNVDLSNTWNYNPQYGRVYKIGLAFQLN